MVHVCHLQPWKYCRGLGVGHNVCGELTGCELPKRTERHVAVVRCVAWEEEEMSLG